MHRSCRAFALTGLAMTAALLAACSAPGGSGGTPTADSDDATSVEEVPDVPSEPVALNILDVAGNLKLTQPMIEAFAEANPDIVSSVTFEAAGSPDLVGTLKPQIESGNLQIDLVLSGTDAMSAGITENLWVPVVTDFGDRLPNMDNYTAGAVAMQELAEGYGVQTAYTPSGPLLWYNPDEVSADEAPTTPEEVLAWAAANPGKFGYPRPANSGPGRTWLQGLPYLLGDEDPYDPENGWDKTWAYLDELNQYIDNYPTGTGQAVSNMADGTWTMMPITMGWDVESRADGRAPAGLEVAQFAEYTWVSDSHYALMPRGLSPDKQSAILLLLNDLLTPEQNAKAYDNGYHYPGPVVAGATLELAPAESQQVIAEFGRDWYDDAIAAHDSAVPLPAAELVAAFDIWDRQIGAGKYEAS